MPTFKVEKNSNFTVLSNGPMKDISLSNKALGLLVRMLSLPPEWDFTQKGLAAICQEGEAAISSQLRELEQKGYLIRNRIRNEKGHLTDVEYIIYEESQTQNKKNERKKMNTKTPKNGLNKPSQPKGDFPVLDNPVLDNPTLEKPKLDNQALLNTNILNNNELSTKSINPSNNPPDKHQATSPDVNPDTIDTIDIIRQSVMEQINYTILCNLYSDERVDEIINIITDAITSTKSILRVGGEDKPLTVVKSQFTKLTDEHIGYVFDSIDKGCTEIRNIHAYLLTALYEAPNTINNHYQAEFKYRNRIPP